MSTAHHTPEQQTDERQNRKRTFMVMKAAALFTVLVIIGLLAILSLFQKSSVEVQWTQPKLELVSYRNESSQIQWEQNKSLADFKGQFVLATLWAYNCWPCTKELPLMNQLVAKIGNPDLNVMAFHIGNGAEETEQANSFWLNENMSFQNVFVTSEWATKAFETAAMPSHFLFNREGKLVWKHEGAIQWVESPVEQFLTKALLDSLPPLGSEPAAAESPESSQ